MNLTSELSIFAYKEPKESEWEEGRRGASTGGGGHEGREVDGLKERQKTRTSCVIGKASD